MLKPHGRKNRRKTKKRRGERLLGGGSCSDRLVTSLVCLRTTQYSWHHGNGKCNFLASNNNAIFIMVKGVAVGNFEALKKVLAPSFLSEKSMALLFFSAKKS